MWGGLALRGLGRFPLRGRVRSAARWARFSGFPKRGAAFSFTTVRTGGTISSIGRIEPFQRRPTLQPCPGGVGLVVSGLHALTRGVVESSHFGASPAQSAPSGAAACQDLPGYAGVAAHRRVGELSSLPPRTSKLLLLVRANLFPVLIVIDETPLKQLLRDQER